MKLKLKRILSVFTALLSIFAMLGSSVLFSITALADGSLRRGDKGTEVENLQKLLKQHDCYNFDQITGYFGAVTEDGVRKYQAQNGITVDGVAGSDTMAKLKQVGSKPKDPDSLCVGMSGTKVEDIQKRLKQLGLYTEPEITGYFGPITEKAVKAFQEAAGMKVDGIVGKVTKAAMFASYKSTTLIPGMKGDSVSKLQNRLKDLGYYDGSVSALYGQITQKAVQYFQKLNGLGQDGICGKSTYSAIFAKNAKTEKVARRAQTKPDTNPNPTPTYHSVPGQSAFGQKMGQAIVAYAKLNLGKPYAWGKEGPNSFDCSGLTWYVYKHFGVTLPRCSTSQGNMDYGIKILSQSKLLPGDLMFFHGSNGVIGHAGIYVGNNCFIEAPYTGVNVRITNFNHTRNWSWGRRIFK